MIESFKEFWKTVILGKKTSIEDEEKRQLAETHSELLRAEAKVENWQSACDLYRKRIARLQARIDARSPVSYPNVAAFDERQNHFRQG